MRTRTYTHARTNDENNNKNCQRSNQKEINEIKIKKEMQKKKRKKVKNTRTSGGRGGGGGGGGGGEGIEQERTIDFKLLVKTLFLSFVGFQSYSSAIQQPYYNCRAVGGMGLEGELLADLAFLCTVYSLLSFSVLPFLY